MVPQCWNHQNPDYRQMYRKNDPISLTKQFTEYQRDGRLKRVLSTGCWCGVWWGKNILVKSENTSPQNTSQLQSNMSNLMRRHEGAQVTRANSCASWCAAGREAKGWRAGAASIICMVLLPSMNGSLVTRKHQNRLTEWKASQELSGGTSLVVQWLTLWAPDARGQRSIPGQGIRSHML